MNLLQLVQVQVPNATLDQVNDTLKSINSNASTVEEDGTKLTAFIARIQKLQPGSVVLQAPTKSVKSLPMNQPTVNLPSSTTEVTPTVNTQLTTNSYKAKVGALAHKMAMDKLEVENLARDVARMADLIVEVSLNGVQETMDFIPVFYQAQHQAWLNPHQQMMKTWDIEAQVIPVVEVKELAPAS